MGWLDDAIFGDPQTNKIARWNPYRSSGNSTMRVRRIVKDCCLRAISAAKPWRLRWSSPCTPSGIIPNGGAVIGSIVPSAPGRRRNKRIRAGNHPAIVAWPAWSARHWMYSQVGID